MSNIPLTDRVRLAKVLGKLGSDFPGERDAAALAAMAILRQHEATWPDVLLSPPAPTRPRPASPMSTGWRALARQCAARLDDLNAWQSRFINDILGLKSLSPKQLEKLREIAIELGIEDPQ